jgi:hypothetical protein
MHALFSGRRYPVELLCIATDQRNYRRSEPEWLVSQARVRQCAGTARSTQEGATAVGPTVPVGEVSEDSASFAARSRWPLTSHCLGGQRCKRAPHSRTQGAVRRGAVHSRSVRSLGYNDWIRSDRPRWVVVLPLHGLGRLVVLTNVQHELSLQIGNRCEHAPSDHIALYLGKPGRTACLRQTRAIIMCETPIPAGNEVIAAIELVAHSDPAMSSFKQKDQPCPSRQGRGAGLFTRLVRWFGPLVISQLDRSTHR